VATEYKRNPVTGELEECTVPDTAVPAPDSTDETVVIVGKEGTPVDINADGQMHVVLRGLLDEGNSTHEELIGGATFVGDPIDTLDYSMVFITVFSDQDSAIDGLVVEQGHSETEGGVIHWDIDDTYTVFANTGKPFAIGCTSQYMRVSYTNGTEIQTDFRLHLTLKKGYSLPTSHRLGDNHIVEDDASLQKAVLLQEHPDGTIKNVSTPHPLSGDNHVIFSKDLDLSVSNNNGFDGDVTDYFDSLLTVSSNASATNPKQILLWFNNTVYASEVGFGCNDLAKSFSNIKMNFLGSGQVIRSVYDESSDNTKHNSRVVGFAPTAFNGILLEFHTSDEVGLSNITIRKEQKTASQIQATNPDGILINIGATDSGNLKTTNAENGLSIAKGNVAGSTFIHKFGAAPDFDTADGYVNIWDGANDAIINAMQYVYSTTADITSLSSSNNGDTQDIEVQGLDVNYDLVVQTKTLTGQTEALLDTPLIRVFRMKNVGSTDVAGILYCYTSAATVAVGVPSPSSTIRAAVNNGNNQTLMAIYTIPAGKTGYMRDWYASTAGAKRASSHIIKVEARPFGQVFQLKHVASINDVATSYIQHTYVEPEVFAEKTDIQILMNTDQNEAGVSAGFDIVLIDN